MSSACSCSSRPSRPGGAVSTGTVWRAQKPSRLLGWTELTMPLLARTSVPLRRQTFRRTIMTGNARDVRTPRRSGSELHHGRLRVEHASSMFTSISASIRPLVVSRHVDRPRRIVRRLDQLRNWPTRDLVALAHIDEQVRASMVRGSKAVKRKADSMVGTKRGEFRRPARTRARMCSGVVRAAAQPMFTNPMAAKVLKVSAVIRTSSYSPKGLGSQEWGKRNTYKSAIRIAPLRCRAGAACRPVHQLKQRP